MVEFTSIPNSILCQCLTIDYSNQISTLLKDTNLTQCKELLNYIVILLLEISSILNIFCNILGLVDTL